jgi:MtfA peptidase
MPFVPAFLSPYQYVLLFLALLVGWLVVIRLRRRSGVWRLRFFALPRPWLKHIHAHVPLYPRLPWELRAPYQDKVLQFVDAKGFRACAAMSEVTELMRVTIAGNACLLLLNGSGEPHYPEVLAVQVFPAGDPNAEARSSCVAMHWDEAKQLATDPRDKGNPDLPVIALKLGWEAAGRPALPETLLLTAWARVRSAEFVRRFPGVLEKIGSAAHARSAVSPAVTTGRRAAAPGPSAPAAELTIFDPADIFAVATEMFLAAPALLRERQPALYADLRQFYHVDPARWTLSK